MGKLCSNSSCQDGTSSVVNHYDPTSSQIRALTSGGQEFAPVIKPDGSGFFYIDGNAQRSLKFCSLPNNSKCDSLLERGLVRLLGVSPSGQRWSSAPARDSDRDCGSCRCGIGRSQDFGPVVYHCPVRWDGEDRFWSYARTGEFSGWTEFDVRSGRPTGNTKPQHVEAGEVCPPPETAPDILKRVLSLEAELWRVPIDD